MTTNDSPTSRDVSESPSAAGFVAYDYLSPRVPRELQSLYLDTYRGFGWIAEATPPAHALRQVPLAPLPPSGFVTLSLKRERGIRNRHLVHELQRKAEKSLAVIARYERSKSSVPIAAALGIGILGSAFLAGSVFALEAGVVVGSIAMGAVGLLLWVGGYVAHGLVKNRRTAEVGPLIDREHDVLYEAADQAYRLLN